MLCVGVFSLNTVPSTHNLKEKTFNWTPIYSGFRPYSGGSKTKTWWWKGLMKENGFSWWQRSKQWNCSREEWSRTTCNIRDQTIITHPHILEFCFPICSHITNTVKLTIPLNARKHMFSLFKQIVIIIYNFAV